MIVNQAQRTCEIGNSDAHHYRVHQMTIKSNRQMFNLLVSNIYTDKPLAVVRETLCNAWDAHVVAGKQDIPIQIHLPTAWEPWYSITDFGPGLAEEALYQLYMVFGGSDKTATNTLIGGKGIGGKAPLAYTDQFTVTSRHDGHEMVFQTYLNDEGCPCCVKMSDTPTSKPSGITINVPVVRTSDARLFDEALGTLYPFMNTKPTVTPNPPENITLDLANYPLVIELPNEDIVHKIALRKRPGYRQYGFGELRVIQGIVPYKADTRAIIGTDQSDLLPTGGWDVLQSYDVLLWTPIGSADLTASREAIELNDRSKDTLRTAIAAALTKTIAKLTAQLDAAQTWHEWNTIARALPIKTDFPTRLLTSDIVQSNNGRGSSTYIQARALNDPDTSDSVTLAENAKNTRRGNQDGFRKDSANRLTFDHFDNCVFLAQERPNWPTKTYLRDHHFDTEHRKTIICIGKAADVAARLDQFGIPHGTIEQIPYIKAARGSRTAQARKLGATKYPTHIVRPCNKRDGTPTTWTVDTRECNAIDLLALAEDEDRNYSLLGVNRTHHTHGLLRTLNLGLVTAPTDRDLVLTEIPDHHNRVQEKILGFFDERASRGLFDENSPLTINQDIVTDLQHSEVVCNQLEKWFGADNTNYSRWFHPFETCKGYIGALCRRMLTIHDLHQQYKRLKGDNELLARFLRQNSPAHEQFMLSTAETAPDWVHQIENEWDCVKIMARRLADRMPEVHAFYAQYFDRSIHRYGATNIDHCFPSKEYSITPLLHRLANTLPQQE